MLQLRAKGSGFMQLKSCCALLEFHNEEHWELIMGRLIYVESSS